MKLVYKMHTRSQHAKTGKKGFSGPDTYVAVTIAPEGVIVPYNLNRSVLRSRGIKIRYFGEGYSEHTSMRSTLGQAIAKAKEYVWWKNYCEQAWEQEVA